jgi:hypothetical protein
MVGMAGDHGRSPGRPCVAMVPIAGDHGGSPDHMVIPWSSVAFRSVASMVFRASVILRSCRKRLSPLQYAEHSIFEVALPRFLRLRFRGFRTFP